MQKVAHNACPQHTTPHSLTYRARHSVAAAAKRRRCDTAAHSAAEASDVGEIKDDGTHAAATTAAGGAAAALPGT